MIFQPCLQVNLIQSSLVNTHPQIGQVTALICNTQKGCHPMSTPRDAMPARLSRLSRICAYHVALVPVAHPNQARFKISLSLKTRLYI